MASATMTMPLNSITQKRVIQQVSASSFINPLPIKSLKAVGVAPKKASVAVQCSLKEKVVTGLTAASLTASMVIPEVSHAADGDLSPSLKNFLLSIVAGGVVLAAIIGAVIGVSNFDPVKRS